MDLKDKDVQAVVLFLGTVFLLSFGFHVVYVGGEHEAPQSHYEMQEHNSDSDRH